MLLFYDYTELSGLTDDAVGGRSALAYVDPEPQLSRRCPAGSGPNVVPTKPWPLACNVLQVAPADAVP